MAKRQSKLVALLRLDAKELVQERDRVRTLEVAEQGDRDEGVAATPERVTSDHRNRRCRVVRKRSECHRQGERRSCRGARRTWLAGDGYRGHWRRRRERRRNRSRRRGE